MAEWSAGWSGEAPDDADGVLALCEGSVVRPGAGWLHDWDRMAGLLAADSDPVFVGRFDGRSVYVVELARMKAGDESGHVSLREALLETEDAPVGLISTSVQVLQWWRDHRFCGRCGQPTDYHPTERARWCRQCQVPWYARLAPCVIVVIRRENRFLLARSSRTRRYYYSLIAGFVEPGESAEEAVKREVMEETGLTVNNIRYRTSQSWPFPHQLMLGYFADYVAGDLVLQEDELAAADWFEPGLLPPVPPATTIAGHLIRVMEQEISCGEGPG
ncbi:NAD(+) diphosphatase [Marinobacter sp.]|uniref:NAD(+) diphosphatase n=1 Tax=Marinobacter sp. TaxID=50741 RepID=UPI00384B6D16